MDRIVSGLTQMAARFFVKGLIEKVSFAKTFYLTISVIMLVQEA